MPWSRRRVRREVLARLKRLAVLVALELIVAATGLVQAQARTLSAHAAEMSGFGRLALEFDQPTTVKTKLANGILVIAFFGAGEHRGRAPRARGAGLPGAG